MQLVNTKTFSFILGTYKTTAQAAHALFAFEGEFKSLNANLDILKDANDVHLVWKDLPINSPVKGIHRVGQYVVPMFRASTSLSNKFTVASATQKQFEQIVTLKQQLVSSGIKSENLDFLIEGSVVSLTLKMPIDCVAVAVMAVENDLGLDVYMPVGKKIPKSQAMSTLH